MESRTREACGGRKGLLSESWLSSHPSSASSRGVSGPVLGGTSGLLGPWFSLQNREQSLSTSFQGPSGSRPQVARVWGVVQKPMRKQHRPWRSLIFGALTPTPACPAPAVAWVRAFAEWVLWLTQHRARHVAGTQRVGIRRSLVPAPDGSPLPGARSASRVGGAAPFYSFPSSSQASLWSSLLADEGTMAVECVGARGGSCVIFPDRQA